MPRWSPASSVLLVMVGGAVGSGLRYLTAVGVDRWAGRPAFPLATLAVNLVGCLLIGLLVGRFADRWAARPEAALLLVVGLLGGFTTFSAFALESARLLHAGRYAALAAYLALSNGGGVALAVVGLWVGRRAAGLP